MIEDRKSYDRRHSQDMIPRKPARVCKFFPAPRYNTRTLGVGACIKEEIKLPRKSSKSTSFPQKTFFRSLSVTTGTSTCSAAPTQIIKYIKTHKSIMHRGTVPRKFKGDICLKQSSKDTEKSKKPAKPCTVPGTKPATPPGKKPCLTSGAKISSTPGPKPCTKPGTKPGTTPGTKPGTTPGTKPCATQNLTPCEKQSHEREHLKKRSTGFSTKPVQTRSRKVMLQTTYPVIRFQPRSQVVTCTRGVNTRKPECCFVTGYRKFQQKRKLRKAADDQRKILICKKGAKSPKTSQSSRSSPRSSSGSPTPGSSKSALQAKQLAERKKQLAERKKQLAKEKAKGKSKEQAKAAAKQKEKQRAEALAKQKAKQRSSTAKSLSQKEKEQKLKKERAKAQAKQKAKERAKQKAKNRAKALKGRGKKSKPRKKKGKKNLKKNAGKAFKKLASSGYEVKCEDMMASPNRPCKIIHDIWPSAYPAFMVLYKMYNSVCHLIFFVLACCIWSPLFCWCFMFYFFIIKRMFC
ncbi:PREDICTED: coiled-coil domain-containing protein 86-like [Papilio polytes]|uniref:coiled-coil domain-containing protein 86-like n=1 Tax=Papilio polytes TaxID=76194 RepID=UPI0006767374|nr:PREDICTED: coiled-coil domain-containing protein 86-like [Papilio polytes]